MRVPDSTDEQLAGLLGQDARQNSETLAKRLKLSSATVRRRLRKLIRSDLLHIVGVVDYAKFGFPVAVVIALNVAHGNLESATEDLVKKPEIRWLSTTTGRFDIIAVARFRSTNGLSEFMAKDMARLEGVKDSETFVCLDLKKGSYSPFPRL